MLLKFSIDGEPVGKGRPRFSRRGSFVTTYTPKATMDYEEHVLLKCREEMAKNGFKGWMDGQPLSIEITAYYPIRKSYSKVVKDAIEKGVMKPTKKPDADNILKIIADGLNGIAYKDDAQIIEAYVVKKYGVPRVEVEIREVVCGS